MPTAQRTIERSVAICGSLAECWRNLTEPESIRLWFADVEGGLDRPGAKFSFHFGDGDFFSGRVLTRQEPAMLRFEWQFMGVGGVSSIAYCLHGVDAHNSILKVSDEGEYSDRAVVELSEGWDDFLSRLARKMATGENARYRWSEQIDTGVIVTADVPSALAKVRDAAWWQAVFPKNTVGVSAVPDGAAVVFGDAAWSGHETEANVKVTERSGGAGISVSHAGWLSLSREIQFDERKRFAGLWATALRRIQDGFNTDGSACSVSQLELSQSLGS